MMVKSVGEPKETDKKVMQSIRNSLVLSIDINERITKFNRECEQISGYSKDHVLNKRLFDFLVPGRYREQWKKFLNYARENRIIDNFKFPLLTHQGHEIMVSWSSFPTRDANGVVSDINLVGNLVIDWNDSAEPMVSNKKIEIKDKAPDKGKTYDYEVLYKSFKKLEKVNVELERKNKILEKNFNNLNGRFDLYKKKIEKKSKESGGPFGKGLYSFSELFGGKKRRQEFENMKCELDERQEILNKIESRVLAEKKKINDQIAEFRDWREKLESLEEEIAKRWKELNHQEKLLTCQMADTDVIPIDAAQGVIAKDHHELIEKIPECAAVVQRGILKHVNGSFADLIGYNVDEIVEKSFFDFIVPECFYDIEKYYLNRLKGENVTGYETIILTKNSDKIPVEISTKPTFFKGEKAEIVVVKKSNKISKK